MALDPEPLYLYCATATASVGPSLGPIGIGERGDQVCAVSLDGVSLVVSRAPRIPFAQIPPEQTLRHLAAHQRVIEQVMTRSTVVPVKFGTYADGEEAVRKILRDNRGDLQRALDRFEGTIELDVVVTWPDLGPVFAEIAREKAVRRLKAAIPAVPAGQALEERIKLGELVKERLDLRRRDLAEEILRGIRALARDVSVNDLKDHAMILNAALLLDRSAERALDARVAELNDRFNGTLNFRCVGPLPPYSFATAEVQTIDAETVDAARSALGLPPAASFNEIKQAHRGLARQLHPDTTPTEAAAARLQEAGAAFRVLEQYCHNVKHSLAAGQCQGLALVKIRKLSELRAAATAASSGH